MKQRLVNDPLVLSFAVALFVALTGNLSFLHALAAAAPAQSGARVEFLVGTGLILVLLLGLALALFALPYLWKPAASALLLAAAFCAHFMDSYGVVIDRSMVRNVFETNVGEASEFLTLRLLLHLLAFGVLPVLFVARARLVFASWRREALRRVALVAGVVAVIAGVVTIQFKQFAMVGRSHEELRMLVNPASPAYATWRYLKKRPERGVVAALAEDATRVASASARPLLVVLVVGETARAANFSLGGYPRETNPELASRPIIYFSDVTSCGTDTSASLPCMLWPFGRVRYREREARQKESLLDLMQRVGVSVLWRDNNSGCKNTCDRVPHQDRPQLSHETFCDGDGCFDEVLLEGLPAWIGALPGDGLLVLHQAGSHGPAYYKRSPVAFKKFLPECGRAAVEGCTRDEIVNAYDNTILYTDFVLDRLIGLLEREAGRFDVLMLYVSDHGESLGEHGLYLHGMPWMLAPREQTHVPMLMWLSESFSADRGVARACVEQRRHEKRSHDDLFHTVLGLFDVRSQVYQPELDLLRPCRTGLLRASG